MSNTQMYYITIYQKWSSVPVRNRVATQGTEMECLEAGREIVEGDIARMSNEVIQYELSGYKYSVEGSEITITYNVRSIDPCEVR